MNILAARVARCESVVGGKIDFNPVSQQTSAPSINMENRVADIERSIAMMSPDVKAFFTLYDSLSHIIDGHGYQDYNIPYDVKVYSQML